ncbi:hypothetical protein DFH06DRAFT_1422249 [Mycena polygramma]|nr:hypothetical protein DFH06DRAFT_1422249 [Mycena polygramma]
MLDDTVSLLSNLASGIPHGLLVAVTVFSIAASGFLLRAAFPTQLMKSLNASLLATEQLYFDTFETHLFNESSKADMDLAARLLVLEDNAAKLRLQTLFHGTFFVQWGELWGICTGQSFAIWRCTRKIQCLGSEMQMRHQEKLHELHKVLTAGASPTWKLTMRQRYHGRNMSSDRPCWTSTC